MSLRSYITATTKELSHVVWPTRTRTVVYTILVIVISVALAYLLGLFDFFFARGVETFI